MVYVCISPTDNLNKLYHSFTQLVHFQIFEIFIQQMFIECMFQTLFQMLGMHIINTVEKIKFLYPPCLLGSIPPLRWGKIFC